MAAASMKLRPSGAVSARRSRMPRPKLHPNEAQRNLVKSMAACGITHQQIAKRIGIRSPKTLRKHFRRELDDGITDANYEIGKSLFESARKGDTDAAKFW